MAGMHEPSRAGAPQEAPAESRPAADASEIRSGSAWRASGLFVLAMLVLLGVGVTAGYLQWKAPEVHSIVEARRSEVAAAPSSTEGRLVHWSMYANALIHNRLQEMRFSAREPWLVAYAVSADSSERNLARGAASDTSAVEMYGVDLADLSRDPAWIDGSRVVVRLPRARDLGRAELVGDNAPFVPVIPDARPLPDANQRAKELATWALQGLAQALERDIPKAHLEVEIGPETSWAEIASTRAARAADAANREASR
jgi:hypothetical protein